MTWIRNNLKIAVPGGIVLAAVFAFLAFGVFGIHTKFIDDEVSESGPVFASGANASGLPSDAVSDEVIDEMNDVMKDEETPLVVEAADPMPEAADEPAADDGAADEQAADDGAADDGAADEGAADDPAVGEPAASEAATDEPAAAAPGEIVTLIDGNFVARSHPGSGIAKVLNDGSEQRFLRFEEFETDNGPDLFVYLTRADAAADAGAFGVDGDFVNLGRLKGNVGDQNYEIPVDVDLDQFDTVVVWCDRFSVAFTAADLS